MFERNMPDNVGIRSEQSRQGYPFEVVMKEEVTNSLWSFQQEDIHTQIVRWLQDNIPKARVRRGNLMHDDYRMQVYFKNEEETSHFKLAWGEYVDEVVYTPSWVNGLKV